MSGAQAADVKVPAARKVKVLKAPPLPPPPTWFFSAEGGAACSNSNVAVRSRFVPGADLAHLGSDCGWTTRLGFGQEHTALFGGMADYWGVFVRYTRIQDSAPVNGVFGTFFPGFAPLYAYNFNANAGFDEKRTVIDFEAGRDIGIGDGSKLRAIAGLRFAHYSSDTTLLGLANGFTANFFTKQQFDGLGPRLGFSYRRPLVGMVELAAEGSAAALWGRFKTSVNDSLCCAAYSISGQESHNGWVGNLEGSIALAYAPYGPRGWDVSLGIRAEDWFGQIDTSTFSASSTKQSTPEGPLSISGQREDRFNWGPFLRVKVPFGN
ncbi:MAG: Lpg1974 family pore-forming outer membrane protein [Xanthobacteraceae bacterium]